MELVSHLELSNKRIWVNILNTLIKPCVLPYPQTSGLWRVRTEELPRIIKQPRSRFHGRSFLKAIRWSDSVKHSVLSYVVCALTDRVLCTLVHIQHTCTHMLHTFIHKHTKNYKYFFLYSRLFKISKTSIMLHEKHYKHLSKAKITLPRIYTHL